MTKTSSSLFRICTFILPILFLITMSCKEAKSDNPLDPSNRSANVEELYKGYYQNPTTFDEKQQNEIIDHIIDNDLDMIRLESGMYMMLTQRGIGPNLEWGEEVIVHYRGTYLDGREFDSSYSRGKPFKTAVGSAITGWNEALRRMKSGTKVIVILPSRLAYGSQEYAGIPPNSILKFEMHVLI